MFVFLGVHPKIALNNSSIYMPTLYLEGVRMVLGHISQLQKIFHISQKTI